MKKTQIRRSKIWVTQMSMQTIRIADGTSKALLQCLPINGNLKQ